MQLKIISLASVCFVITPQGMENVKILCVFDNSSFAKKIFQNLMSQPFTTVDLKHLCVLEIGVC